MPVIIPPQVQLNKEKNMKSLLLLLAAAVLFVNTLVVPTIAHADGVGGTDCGGQGQLCKP